MSGFTEISPASSIDTQDTPISVDSLEQTHQDSVINDEYYFQIDGVYKFKSNEFLLNNFLLNKGDTLSGDTLNILDSLKENEPTTYELLTKYNTIDKIPSITNNTILNSIRELKGGKKNVGGKKTKKRYFRKFKKNNKKTNKKA
jgi:hypothetical protein